MSYLFDNLLILSPHPDDEVLGCGGLLLSDHVKQAHVRYFNAIHPTVDFLTYMTEAENVQRFGTFERSFSPLVGVNRLDLYPIAEFIADIEQTINNLRPTTLLIPALSRNQDHRVIHHAALTAIRPHDTNWYVPNILIYEQAEYLDENFIPHLYVPIDIKEKLALFSLYQSQQRGHRTPEHLTYLAGLRGMQCNQPFAEAFQVIRLS